MGRGVGNSFAVFTAAGRILGMLAGFCMPIFLTRFLSLSEYGLYSQFYTLLGFLGTMFAFGMQSNLYYFCPRAEVGGRKTCVGNTFLVLVSLALFSTVLLCIPSLSGLFLKDGGLSGFSKVLAVCVAFYIPSNILYPLFVIRGDRILSVLFPPMEIVLKLVLVIVSALVWGTLDAIFFAVLILQGLIFLFVVFYAFYYERRLSAPWLDLALLGKQMKYILPFSAAVVLSVLFNRFDKLLCIRYITPEEYAVYSVAFFGIPGITQIYDSLSEVNLLNMTEAYRNGDSESTLSLYRSFTSKLLSFSLPLIFSVFVFADNIIGFFFPKPYLASVPFFRIYILSFIFGAMGAGTVLRATGHTNHTLHSYLLTLVIYLPLSYMSIKNFGTRGAIATAMTGMILPKIFQIYFEKSVLGVKLSAYMPWRSFGSILVISLLPLLPLITIARFCDVQSIILTCCIIAIYIVAVYLIELKFGLFIVDIATVDKFLCKYRIRRA